MNDDYRRQDEHGPLGPILGACHSDRDSGSRNLLTPFPLFFIVEWSVYDRLAFAERRTWFSVEQFKTQFIAQNLCRYSYFAVQEPSPLYCPGKGWGPHFCESL